MSVDTACSSSLAALFGAALCVRSDESPAMLTVAVNLVLDPRTSVTFARAGMLSADGRCKAFDAVANGYVRAEGVGGLVISSTSPHETFVRLSSVVVQQDGMSASLTAPNGSAQVTLVGNAIRRAVTDSSTYLSLIHI